MKKKIALKFQSTADSGLLVPQESEGRLEPRKRIRDQQDATAWSLS